MEGSTPWSSGHWCWPAQIWRAAVVPEPFFHNDFPAQLQECSRDNMSKKSVSAKLFVQSHMAQLWKGCKHLIEWWFVSSNVELDWNPDRFWFILVWPGCAIYTSNFIDVWRCKRICQIKFHTHCSLFTVQCLLFLVWSSLFTADDGCSVQFKILAHSTHWTVFVAGNFLFEFWSLSVVKASLQLMMGCYISRWRQQPKN